MTVEVNLTPIQFGQADGDRFEVLPEVTNTGDSQVTDTIELSVDNTTRYSRDVTLDPGERRHVKLVWDVETSSDTRVPMSVSSSDETVSDQVTLRVNDDRIEVSIGDSDYSEDYIA